MAKKTKAKSTTSTASSWWEERSKILANIKPKPYRAKANKVKAKVKKVTKVKKATKAKKATKTKKTKKGKR